jgi:hypothetical protein
MENVLLTLEKSQDTNKFEEQIQITYTSTTL